MRTLLFSATALALAVVGAARAADAPAPRAQPAHTGKDVAAFPDVTLIHRDFQMPAGWRWAPHDPKTRNSMAADFDGDGNTDYMARIVHDCDSARAVAVYLGRFSKPGRWMQPIILTDKSLKDLDRPW